MRVPDRSCGECVVCCVYQKIPALDKPAMKHCKNLKLLNRIQPNVMQLSSNACGNCKIYEERPQVCKAYACMWLAGYGKESDRPDRSRLLIDTTHRIENGLEVKQLEDGAADTKKGRRTIRRIARDADATALVLSFKETKILRVEGRAP